MAKFDSKSDALGGVDDRIRLLLGGQELRIFENYELQCGILRQPESWTVRLGWGDVARDLLKKYPPRTRFQLFIGPVLQMTGVIDAINANQTEQATTLTIKGRDSMAELMRGHVQAEKSFSDTTYKALAAFALTQVGYNIVNSRADVKDPLVDKVLFSSNQANRSVRAGVQVQQLAPIGTVDQILTNTEPGAPRSLVVGVIKSEVQSKLGELWLAFCRRHFDRAGLILASTADGNFVLTSPNIHQAPVYRILRQRGQTRAQSNVELANFDNDTTNRPAEIAVFGKGGGRKAGRGKMKGDFKDAEMQAFGFRDALVVRDSNTKTPQQALFLARRKIAEARRDGYRLEYRVTGHTTGALGTASGERAVWTPDTLVNLQDDEYGLSGVFYLSDCTYRRGSDGTTTTLRLMRLEDMLFGEPEDG